MPITTLKTENSWTPKKPLIKIQLNHNGLFPITDKTSIWEQVNLGYAINNKNIIHDKFALGGIQQIVNIQMPFIGLHDAQIQSHSIASVGAGIQHAILKDFYTSLKANAACYDYGNPFDKKMLEEAKYVTGIGVGLAYYLPALPVDFNLMYSPDMKELYSHISIGFIF